MNLKPVFFTAIFLLSLNLFAQSKFQNGYYVTNNGDRVTCLIKNEDWKSSPKSFRIKRSANSEAETINVSLVKEFGVDNNLKYIKRKVDVDISPWRLSELNYDSNPVWEEREVMLEVIVEGDASLYFYEEAGLKRYFYNIGNGKVIQLVYKKYKTSESAIAENNKFRQQMYNSFYKCDKLTMQDFEAIRFNRPSMSKLIIKYNDCNGSDTKVMSNIDGGIDFNVKAKVGVFNNSIDYRRNSGHHVYADFGSTTGWRIELEAEVVLPFNNGKWAAYWGLAKNSNLDIDKAKSGREFGFEYAAIEGLLGIRHYLLINEKSKASVKFGYVMDFASKFIVKDSNGGIIWDVNKISGSFSGGIGYHFKDYSIEANYNFNRRTVEVNTPIYSSDKNVNLFITFAYNIF